MRKTEIPREVVPSDDESVGISSVSGLSFSDDSDLPEQNERDVTELVSIGWLDFRSELVVKFVKAGLISFQLIKDIYIADTCDKMFKFRNILTKGKRKKSRAHRVLAGMISNLL